MTKLKVTLLLAAVAVAVVNPALAHCGGGYHKPRQAAVAVKKTAMAVRTEPAAQATTAEAAPSGLNTDLIGG
jgi:hypothetical protein